VELEVIVHEEPTGGFWAEVPSLPGCCSEGDTLDELEFNIREAIQGVLAVRSEMDCEPILSPEIYIRPAVTHNS
jgi:predicted RNase H-like HicB family nuclease